MTSHSKNEWWKSLTQVEKRIYVDPPVFFDLCQIYINRYQGNPFMARNAFKSIYEGAQVPSELNYESGFARVAMFNKLRDYAELRDHGADRDGALAILNLESEGV